MKAPWQRTLWAKQPFADNYTPPSFLGQLDGKANGVQPDVVTLMCWSMPLTQQLCLTLTFVGLFLHLQDRNVTSEWLASGSTLTIALCGATMLMKMRRATTKDEKRKGHRRRALARPLSYALLGLVILALSPLLKTLTEATTSDSITALATALFLLSFALADFRQKHVNGHDKEEPHASVKRRRNSTASSMSDTDAEDDSVDVQEVQLPATLSLNAALCASIVLASRLRSPIEVFSLVLTSICIFAFIPRYLRHRIHSVLLAVVITLGMVLIAALLLVRFSIVASFASIAAATFLNIGCPLWMLQAQRWKRSRRGPWDMSVPRLRQRV